MSKNFIYKPEYYNSGHHIYFYDNVSMDSVSILKKQIIRINENENTVFKKNNGVRTSYNVMPIILHIHSYGGDLFAGITAMKVILKSKIPVITFIEGVSASAATLMCVAAKYRLITKHGFMLVHELSTAVYGKYSEIKEGHNFNTKLMNTLKEIYSVHTKIPKKDISNILKRDLFWDSTQCLKYQMVDKIISKKDLYIKRYNIRNNICHNQNCLNIINLNIKKVSLEIAEEYVYKINAVNNSLFVMKNDFIYNVTPNPINILINTDSFIKGWRNTFPIMDSILNSNINITSIVESVCADSVLLLLVVSNKRYIYKHGYIIINKHDDVGGNLDDVTYNFNILQNHVKTILKKYSKLPKNILKNIMKKQIILSSKECLKYGIVDEII